MKLSSPINKSFPKKQQISAGLGHMSHVLPSVNPKPAGFVELIGGFVVEENGVWPPIKRALSKFISKSIPQNPRPKHLLTEKKLRVQPIFFIGKKITKNKKTWGGSGITNPKKCNYLPFFMGNPLRSTPHPQDADSLVTTRMTVETRVSASLGNSPKLNPTTICHEESAAAWVFFRVDPIDTPIPTRALATILP